MKNILLTENGLRNFVRLIIKESEEEYYQISSAELLTMLKFAHNNLDFVSKLKKFEGKPIWVTDSLDLSGRDVKTLGNIVGVSGNLNLERTQVKSLGKLKYVRGNLNISYTKISSFDNVEINGVVSTYDSEYENKKLRAEYNKKLAEAQSRREEGEWDKEGDDTIGDMARAVLEYIGENELTPELQEEKISLTSEMEDLERMLDDEEDDDRIDDLQTRIDEIQERLDELEDYYDVYDIIPVGDGYYRNAERFEVRGKGSLRNPEEYTVIPSEDADDAVTESVRNMIDDIGFDGIHQYIIENNIDDDAVISAAEEMFDEWIRDDPNSYFDESDFELTREQELRKDNLERYISELEDYISELEEKQKNLDDEIEEPEEYSKEYDKIQELIDDAESKKDNAQTEFDEIEPDFEPSEEMIQDKVDDMLYNVRRDTLGFLKDYGFSVKDYVDMDGVLQEMVNNTGYEELSRYDGRYDEIKVGGVYYLVYREN